MAIKGGVESEVMSERTRKLIFSVMADDQRCLPILHILFQYTRCDEIFSWLWRNSFTGTRLLDELRFEFSGSPQALAKFVLGKIERTKKEQILYGHDWKP